MDREISLRLLQSYGATTVLLSFFDSIDQLTCQLWNRWMYNTGVPRVQMKISVKRTNHSFFSHPIGNKFANSLLTYQHDTQTAEQFTDRRLQLRDARIIQSGNDVYAFTWNKKVKVTKYENPFSS